MKKIIVLILVFTAILSYAKDPWKFDRTKVKREYFVPATLDESIAELDVMLSDSAKYLLISPVPDSLSKNEKIMIHWEIRSFGQWIRNNWGLWKGGALADWFRAQNVNHPDNMSDIILTTYKAHLKDKEINSDSLFNYYRAWEEKNMDKVKANDQK